MNEYITDASNIKNILLKNRASYSAYAGYFCSYFPSELLYGFNVHPVRIQGYSESRIQRRDLINYICSYLADIINAFESDHFSWADHLIVPATCDSLYGAKEYLERNIEGLNVKMFRPPLKFDGDTYQFYKSSVEDVLEWMGSHYTFDDAALKKGVEMKNRMNAVINELLSCKEGLFKGSVYLKLMIARSVLPAPVFMAMLEGMDKEVLEQNHKKAHTNLLVLGPLCDNLELIDYMNTDHNVITRFLTSTLGLHDGEVSLEGDVKENLISHYFRKAGTATSYDHYNKLISELDLEITESSVKGVVYLNYKYCEPHMFFSKRIMDHLEKNGMKMLYLELEHSRGIDALIQNQVDTFTENI
jgi:benzoyl-CoA reductase/2-hydroxyglutaryl-CoA dehydratase subunit BcrC/BadD/HgdB